MENYRRENGVSSHGLNHAVNFINVRVRKSLTAIMFAVLLGISGTVTVSKVQAETTSETSDTSGESEETQESVKDTDSVLSSKSESTLAPVIEETDVGGETSNELMNTTWTSTWVNDWTFHAYSDTKPYSIYLQKYNGTATTYTVPATATDSDGKVYKVMLCGTSQGTSYVGKYTYNWKPCVDTGTIQNLYFEDGVEIGGVANCLFYNDDNLKVIDFTGCKMNTVEAQFMFAHCSNLTTVIFNGYCDFDDIEYWDCWFDDCPSLETIVYYANETYTLYYDANGGTGAPGKQSATVTYPEIQKTFTLSSTIPTKTGYTFDGWYTSSTGGTKATSTYTVKNYAGDKKDTLYAQWTANKYTVTYDANDGNGTITADTATYNSSFTPKTNTFTRTNYRFTGWNTSADGNGTSYPAGTAFTYTLTSNITLYAQWEKVADSTIAIKSFITGSMGNKSTDFTYTLQLDKDTYANKTVTTYDIETDTTSELTADENGLLTFTLHNGEELQFTGLTADDLTDASTKISATGLTDAGYTATTSTTTSDDGKTATVTVTGTRNASVPTGNHISSNAENGLVVFGTLGLIAIAIGLYRKKNHA